MNDNELRPFWFTFCILASKVQSTGQFVDHRVDNDGHFENGKTYSSEFTSILIMAASEFENVAKKIIAVSGKSIRKNANIVSLSETLLNLFPHIGETIVSIPYKAFKPLDCWSVKTDESGKLKVEGLSWWRSYDLIKHQKSQHYKEGNLENCIFSVASLFVLNLYLIQLLSKDLKLLSGKPCEYFSTPYEPPFLVAHSNNQLPDFLKS